MPKKSGKVLIVDDDEDVLLAARLLLKKHFLLVTTEKDPEQIPNILGNESYDAILLDMNFTVDVSSGSEGYYWLDRILKIDPSAVVVMITAFGDVAMAVKAIKEGAVDFVLKPWQNEKLLATLSAAVHLRKSRLEVTSLRSRQKVLSADLDYAYNDFVGESPPMMEVFRSIEKVAATDANVLILGENGTGKELVARAIHRRSLRAAEVFINVDAGAIAETLFESELFGHIKGAFTDAKEDRAGRFEVASGGTLFLDEIGNVPLSLQSKLLSVLENRQVTRVGSNKPKSIDIRLISATNMPIRQMVSDQTFRQDLLYRVNTVEIQLPPLRERPSDVPLLVDHFLQRFCQKYKRSLKSANSAALRKLAGHAWPGNVRELQHAVERAVIMSDASLLQPQDFLLSAYEKRDEEGLNVDSYNLETIEKQIIERAISKHDGNISKAARELGLTRTSLYRRMEKYGL